VHGASITPERAAVRARAEHAADGEPPPVRRVGQGEPGLGRLRDELPQRDAALHRDVPGRGVDGHDAVEAPGADDEPLAISGPGARQRRDAVGVAGGGLHLGPRRGAARHGAHQLVLRGRERRARGAARRAVREHAVRAGHGAVGRAAAGRALHGVRRRAGEGGSTVGYGAEEQDGGEGGEDERQHASLNGVEVFEAEDDSSGDRSSCCCAHRIEVECRPSFEAAR